MEDESWAVVIGVVALCVITLIVIFGLAYAAKVLGKVDYLDCEKMSFNNKTDYYVCVQARESVYIRQILSRYEEGE